MSTISDKKNTIVLALIIYSILITVLFGAYVVKSKDNDNKATTASKDVTVIKISPIDSAHLKSKKWPAIEKYSVDIDNDSQPEQIQLQANVQKDSRGKYAWDDGQRWALNVYDGDKVYPLFNRFLQLGEYHLFVGNDPKDKSIRIGVFNVNDCGLGVESYSSESNGKYFTRTSPQTTIDLNNLLYSGLQHVSH